MTTILPIAISSDHRGFNLKSTLIAQMQAQKLPVTDCGTANATDRVDVMDYVLKIAEQLKSGKADRAVIICGSGIMASMVANRFPFIRAALCMSAAQAEAGRSHNDINVLCLASDFTDEEEAEEILSAFLETSTADDPRYAERRAKLAAYDPATLTGKDA